MKLIFALLLTGFLIGYGEKAYSQSYLGGGLTFKVNEVSYVGLNVNAVFPSGEKFRISPSVVLEFDNTHFTANGDLQYVLAEYGHDNALYGLVGIYMELDSDFDMGLNLGIGTDFVVGDNKKIFGEFKYVTENKQTIVSVGIMWNL